MREEDPAERLERDVGRMDEESERVGRRIEDARRDWESKEQDSSVPGAQPEADAEHVDDDPDAEETENEEG
ncbi:MAG: hypothetical protein ABR581_07845 [Thermoleophilaceae bacterium]